MSKFIRKILGIPEKEYHKDDSIKKDTHEDLKIKVEEGTNKAIKEYREVFEKLAEYDRT